MELKPEIVRADDFPDRGYQEVTVRIPHGTEDLIAEALLLDQYRSALVREN